LFAVGYRKFNESKSNDDGRAGEILTPTSTATPTPEVSTEPIASPTIEASPTPISATPTPIIPTPTPIVVSSFPQVHGIAVPWQTVMIGNGKHANENTVLNLTNVTNFANNGKIAIYNWTTGSKGECLISTDITTYLPMAWKPNSDVPAECSGRPLLIGNECEESTQCNTSPEITADGWIKYENWPGRIALCGNLIQNPQLDVNKGFEHCVQSFAAYKAKTGRDVPQAAKWIHLHAYWFANEFTDGEANKMKKELEDWKELADSKGLKIIVSEWGLPFVTYTSIDNAAKGQIQRQEALIYDTLKPELMFYFSFYMDWNKTQLVDSAGNPTKLGNVWKTDFYNKR
jgi:hypothetical protein